MPTAVDRIEFGAIRGQALDVRLAGTTKAFHVPAGVVQHQHYVGAQSGGLLMKTMCWFVSSGQAITARSFLRCRSPGLRPDRLRRCNSP